MKRSTYHRGVKGRKYGIWNTSAKRFQFDICEDTPMLAEARLFQKLGDDARKWRFEPRMLPDAPDTNVGHIDADRMNEIMQAEREGRLVILPCDFGADLWWIDDEKNEVKCEEGDVKGFVVLKDGIRILDQSDEWGRIGTQYYHLTREEAEKALEEAK